MVSRIMSLSVLWMLSVNDPHIPHGEGLNSMKEIIEEFVCKLELNNKCIGVEDLVDLVNFILENNYFEFEDNIYRQILGTAIDVFHKWRLWHRNEARMLFSRSILVSNYQTDMFLCFIFAKIAK